MSESTPFYRFRVLLRASRRIELPALQHGVLYALVGRAFGSHAKNKHVIPDGFMLDAPEVCRLTVGAGQPFAFGFTLIGTPKSAARQYRQIAAGLRRLGKPHKKGTRRSQGLDGNFKLQGVTDLVTGNALDEDAAPQPLPADQIEHEIRRLHGKHRLTLRFNSPLRTGRSQKNKKEGHAFFDRHLFQQGALLHRLHARLQGLGVKVDERALKHDSLKRTRVVSNQLTWVDLAFGKRPKRKSLGGAVGRVVLGGLSPEMVELLVWGQYAHVGENLRFGLGAYRIEELGADPQACPRSLGLLDLAVQPAALDAVAESSRAASGQVQEAARQLRSGDYTPPPPSSVTVGKPNGESRQLAIPPPGDRALQRAMLNTIAAPLDMFFEESSLAYRKGLGRHTAARRIQEAWKEGFHYALHADFRHFFDTIDHAELQHRLDAYLYDPQAVEVIMRWVRNGSFGRKRGLPVGSPLSPVLANLFLDQFDRDVAAEGRKLVRYADDFLILFPTREEAEEVFQWAEDAANSLLLELNQSKTGLVDFSEPFDFLGFRFERRTRWEATPRDRPRRIDEIGWFDHAARPQWSADGLHLAGETPVAPAASQATAVFGPGSGVLTLKGDSVLCRYENGMPATSAQLSQVGTLVVMGPLTVDGRLRQRLAQEQTPVLFCNASGEPTSILASESDLTSADYLIAQADAARDPDRCLQVARSLVSAKLRNHAALARATPTSHNDNLAEHLDEFAEAAAEAESIPSLLGVEGAGAAAWYAQLNKRLPPEFPFPGRVAPNAEDPVNVLLNIAHTFLHRRAYLALRRAGLSPMIGLFHVPRSGHAALASDMQEPFRHLMERAVIESFGKLSPRDFRTSYSGPYKLRVARHAVRHLISTIHHVMAQSCAVAPESESRTYEQHLHHQVRELTQHLRGETNGDPFVAFAHPARRAAGGSMVDRQEREAALV